MKKSILALTVSTLILCYNNDVKAASAVAIGVTSTHSVSNINSREEAVQKVLETCSKGDSNCKIIAKCQKKGFGAVAYEKIDNILTSAGAICGAVSFEIAQEKALKKCQVHAQEGKCKLKSKWVDPI